MSDKKRIKDQEWPLLDRFAADVNTSLSKVYDVLREGRVLRNEELMNRSWFMNFMRAVCGCIDGKMKGYRRPKISDNVSKPEVKETSVPEEKPVEQVIEPEVKETSVAAESMSELLKKNTILIMKWMFERKAQNFHSMTAEGFSKAKIEKAVKELLAFGILKKKNPRRFEPLDWNSLVKDFPEISVPLTEDEQKSLIIAPKKKETTPEVKEQKTSTVAKTEKPKKLTDMEKMVEWLLCCEHPQGEITKGEVVNELRRLKSVKDPYLEATVLLMNWEQQSAISPVPGTFAYRILPTASLLKFNPKPTTSESQISVEKKPTVVKNPDVNVGRDLILRSNGKDVRVVNKSNANITITIENGDIVLTIA